MIELYYYPGNASLAPHFLLEEIGVAHRLNLVDRARNAHKQADYLKLNPKGLIPVLIDGDLTLYESAAICLHLADSHPDSALAPAVGTPARAHMYKWLMHLTNTVQPDFMAWYYPERYTADGEAAPAAKAAAEARLNGHFQVLDDHLAAGPYLLGDVFSLADYFLFMVSRWGRNMGSPPRALANLGRTLGLIAGRPALIRAFAAEGIDPPYF